MYYMYCMYICIVYMYCIVLYCIVYMYIRGPAGGDFFLCGACWTDVSWIKFPRNALRFCSFSLVMFWISVFPWIFNFKFAQYCFQYCHLGWHGVNASVLGYFIQKALTLKYFVFQMLHSMKLIFDIFEYQMVAVTFCLWNMRLHSLQALCSRRCKCG